MYVRLRIDDRKAPSDELHSTMATLQDLCLNTIEKNGTSLREVLKDLPVPKKLTHRHPVLRIFATNPFETSQKGKFIYADLQLSQFQIETIITIEFDGVYTMKWTRKIHDPDYMDLEPDELTALEASEEFQERIRETIEFLKRRDPNFSVWTGLMEFESENLLLEEVKKLIINCDCLYASMVGPSGKRIMNLQGYDQTQRVDNWDCSKYVYELKSAVKGLRKLSVCQ